MSFLSESGEITEFGAATLALALVGTQSPGSLAPLALAVHKLYHDDLRERSQLQPADNPNSHGNVGRSIPDRAANEIRDRGTPLARLEAYTDKEFQRRFKMTKERFKDLCDRLRPIVEAKGMGQVMARASSGSHVPVECMLAASLRWLSGASKLDPEDLYGLGTSTFYEYLWIIVYALVDILQSSFDPYDVEELKRLANDMCDRSKCAIQGCIGAIDGMAVKIKKPTKLDEENMADYFNRKKFYSINLQALADARRRIVYYSLETQGSTHDILAFKLSSLGQALEKKPLPDGFWIAGDEAYICNEWLLTPYGENVASQDKYKDNFNSYLSRCRINVECAFGMLVWRFGVLRRPLGVKLEHVTKVVAVCVLLHNLAIEDGIPLHHPVSNDKKPGDSYEPFEQHKVTCVERGLMKNQVTDKRAYVTEELRAMGRIRPVHQRQKRKRSTGNA